VIAFVACALPKAERNESSTQKELLALVWDQNTLKHVSVVVSLLDEPNVWCWLKTLKSPGGQLDRWLEWLSDSNFEVQHHPGQLHNKTGGLSCLP